MEGRDKSGLTLRELRDLPVTQLRAVGPKLSEQLGEMGIATVLDLIEHYPRRYHDRTNVQEIAQLKPDEEATVTGRIKRSRYAGLLGAGQLSKWNF